MREALTSQGFVTNPSKTSRNRFKAAHSVVSWRSHGLFIKVVCVAHLLASVLQPSLEMVNEALPLFSNLQGWPAQPLYSTRLSRSSSPLLLCCLIAAIILRRLSGDSVRCPTVALCSYRLSRDVLFPTFVLYSPRLPLDDRLSNSCRHFQTAS
ncbi:hypothetical protein Y032_0188g1141 [Ancylostoma ceylanicum]|uniref:Uncharacterized protein n=1 Tax=Ancylostoma ceylanicum TaxID=53326 RepID=A0A016SRI4_9BILA|nr:hypothetical protein Y032_0188g1141 [Ancylostoma ceylanicum]